MLRALIFLFYILSSTASYALSPSPFLNIQQVQQTLGFNSFFAQPLNKSNQIIKVAILDNGFYGYAAEVGKTLPAKLEYHAGPQPPPADLTMAHGVAMAQLLTALTSQNGTNENYLPEMHLYYVNGYTNFKAAIDDVIKRKIDVVLYSQIWEYGSNWDGHGFFNQEVNRATNAGVIWVNAAGNNGTKTFNYPIKTSTQDDWVSLPDPNNSLTVRCNSQNNPSGKCAVRIVLSWNDFKDDVNLGTDKDLDLELVDDLLNIVQTSNLHQSSDPKESREGYSKYPREILTAEVKPGLYYIRVKDQSKNFSANDRMRIIVTGDFVTVPHRSLDNESILNPADNPNVITVGASDDNTSAVSARLGKPEIVAPSLLQLPNGEGEYIGSSNSAAIVAAGIVLLKTLNPSLSRNEVLSKITATATSNNQSNNQSNNNPSFGANPNHIGRAPGQGLSLADLDFSFTGNGCFMPVVVQNLPSHITYVLQHNGILVQTNDGLRIMVDYDPLSLAPNLRRVQYNDRVVMTSMGMAVYPRQFPGSLPPNSIEVFQTPGEAGTCADSGPQNSFGVPSPSLPPKTGAAAFRMPDASKI